ncbi:MAG: hypothetical protein KF858_04335 [Candidatus Sumerlaeia bacterium]|nr:hypothetical protein [Candidatus Sumerlaeia bacterium]
MTHGVVYAATGARHVREALRSARTLRRHMPTVPICLLSAEPVQSPLLTFNVVLEGLHDHERPKLHLDASPFERTLYLDSDTLVAGDLAPVFEVLDRFDFAAHQYSSGYHYTLEGLPNTFPEFNSGVLAFRRTSGTDAFFAAWRDNYARLGERVDQPSLRVTLYESDLRVATLPPEYNFMPYFPNYATDRVRILHGRPHEALVALERDMNRRLGYRSYAPGLGCVMVREALGAGDMVRLLGRAIATCVRGVAVRPARAVRRIARR